MSPYYLHYFHILWKQNILFNWKTSVFSIIWGNLPEVFIKKNGTFNYHNGKHGDCMKIYGDSVESDAFYGDFTVKLVRRLSEVFREKT